MMNIWAQYYISFKWVFINYLIQLIRLIVQDFSWKEDMYLND